jgi:predicted Na+-dependent transporter
VNALSLLHLGWGQILSLAGQVLLPLIVGFVTKRSMPAGVKAVLLLFFTVVAQGITTALESVNSGVAFEWKAWAYNIFMGFVVSVAVHYGLWKPTGAADTAQDAGPVTDRRS